MAKDAKKEPPRLFNISSSLLILPNGVELAPGGVAELDEATVENLGIQVWIDEGLASFEAPRVVLAAPSPEVAALEAALAQMQAERDAAVAALAEATAPPPVPGN